ncbi:MAG: hypothetical protein ABIQ73_26600 [Acidimicrobiales bacterium]
MSEASAKFTRRHKLLLASLATVSLSLGAAGVVSASQNQSAPTGGNPSSEEVDGVNCEDGLVDGVAGAECDGGPAANPHDGADDATETAAE